jgi:hypothetical protein
VAHVVGAFTSSKYVFINPNVVLGHFIPNERCHSLIRKESAT